MDLFNQLKNRWGWKETWQQSRQVLHRWVQIPSVSYAIPRLLVLLDDAKDLNGTRLRSRFRPDKLSNSGSMTHFGSENVEPDI
jgi:hypothetical protein